MIVGAILAARMMELARRCRCVALDDAKRARHAQMHQQHVTRCQVGHQIFGAAAEAGHRLSLQPFDKIFLKGKPQVFAPGLGFEDFRPLHGRLQAAADGLDFG